MSGWVPTRPAVDRYGLPVVDYHYRTRMFGRQSKRSFAYQDNFLHTDWAALSATYGVVAANTDDDSTAFSDGGTLVTGAADGSVVDNYTLWFWRTAVIPTLAYSYRLVYRVTNTETMHCKDTTDGLIVIFDQKAAPNGAPGEYAIYAALPVTEGYHDVIWNSGYWTLAATTAWVANDPTTNIILRAKATNVAAGGDAPAAIFDRFEAWEEDATAAWLLLGLDDGHETQWTAAQYAIGKGVPMYICVNPTDMGTRANWMSWAQAKRLHDTGMVQIVQHLDMFPYNDSDADKRAYMRRNRYLLEVNGIRSGADHYVIPGGTDGVSAALQPSVSDLEIMREYATIVRGTQPRWSGVGYGPYNGGGDYARQVGSPTPGWMQPKTTPHPWWRSSLNISDAQYANVATYLGHAKTHGALIALHAHMFEVAGGTDLSLANWKTMIDAIVALGGDVEYKTFDTLVPS